MSGGDLFILVEGEPHSPEFAFLEIQITKIFGANDIPYFPRVCEVGSSSVFNYSAKPCYKLSKAHKNIPVLAITDNDYRVGIAKQHNTNEKIIRDKNAKILYWKKQEWENYLLDETQFIADFVNQFPKSNGKGKFSKDSDNQITKEDLDDFLQNYFKSSIKQEFFECLKFNLNAKINHPSISKPDCFNEKSFDEIEYWFSTTANNRKATIKPIRENLFEDIINEYGWDKLLLNPDSLLFDFAKNKFQGKEALKKLMGYIKNQYKCRFDSDIFKTEVLGRLPHTSAIITDLTNILRNELL